MWRGIFLICVLFVFSSSLSAQVYFSDNFENGLNEWVVSGQDWDTTSASFSSSNHSVTDSPTGNYSPNTDVRITIKNSLNLASSINPVLIFWQKFYTQGNVDICRVEISTDNGFNWSEIDRYSGGNRTWSYIQLDLSEYKTSSILLRFRLTSDGPNTQYDGWYLDDIEVKELDTELIPFPFFDNFENGSDNWIRSDRGWDITNTNYASKDYSITDSPEGNYTYYENAHLRLIHPINLTGSTNPVLTFWQKFYTQRNVDICRVEISTDNGFNWSEIDRYSGGNRTWSYIQLDLSEYKTSPILLRFRLTSDGPNTQYDGWYLDDIEVKELDAELIAFPFVDNFENGSGNWITSDQGWDITNTNYAGKDNSITDSPGADYTYYENAHLRLIHPIDLTGSTNPVLTFWQKFYTQGNVDICRVEISTDNGFNWSEMDSYSGGNRTWSYIQLDLSEYKTSSILLRFRLTSDGPNTQYDGWYLDNIEVKELDSELTPFPFVDNFENGLNNWLLSEQDWDVTTSTYVSPDNSIVESPGSNYTYYSNTHLLLAHPIDLSTAIFPIITFWQKYYTQNNVDYCRVEISDDAGFSWQEIVIYSGAKTTWHKEQFDLSPYKSAKVLLRFRLTSDGPNTQYEGWSIDDVEIYDLSGNRAPIIDSFTANPNLGEAPLNVSFTASASDADGSIVNYYWDFDGDGFKDDTTLIGSANHIYTETGSYNASCSVSDDQGALSVPAIVSINVYTSTTRVVSVPDDSAAVDATFIVPIRINDVAGIAGAEFRLNFDASVLEVMGVSSTNLTSGFSVADTISDGAVAISMARATGLSAGSGDFVNITFHVLADVLPGETSALTFDQVNLYDADTNPIASTSINGLFTVKKGTAVSGSITEIYIVPGIDTLATDQTALFSAYAIDAEENQVEIDVNWVYDDVFLSPGNIGSATGQTTLFTAGGVGDGYIAASYVFETDTLVDTAYVIVGDIKGDINVDETVNVPDAILCLQIAADILAPSLYQNWAADFNNNQDINAGDALGILNQALSELFPKNMTANNMVSNQTGVAVVYTQPEYNQSTGILNVPVCIDDRSNICGVDLAIEYNTLDYELIDVSASNITSLIVKNFDNLKFSSINHNGLLNNNAEILCLYFKQKNKNATHLGLNFSSLTLFDYQGNTLNSRIELNRMEYVSIPKNYVLHQNYPNPFNPSTTITFDIPDHGNVTISVYNVNGQFIRTLVSETMDAGSYSVSWHGEDNSGQLVSSGVYFYKIEFDKGHWQDIRKMLFVK